jgi:hypothetical protein
MVVELALVRARGPRGEPPQALEARRNSACCLVVAEEVCAKLFDVCPADVPGALGQIVGDEELPELVDPVQVNPDGALRLIRGLQGQGEGVDQ